MMRNNPNTWWFRLGLWVFGSLVLADTVCAQNTVSFLVRRDFQVGLFPSSVTLGDFKGYVQNPCKKLQAREARRPEIISCIVFGRIINPTVFFVHDFDHFYRLKMVY
jgi:hypothetical protein